MLTIPRANGWISETLKGDATLAGLINGRVYRRAIPENPTMPLVSYQHQGGTVLSVVGAIRVWGDLVYVVKAYATTHNNETLVPIMDRVDALLHGASGTFDGQHIWSCTLEEEIELDDPDGYTQLGGIYRIRVEA